MVALRTDGTLWAHGGGLRHYWESWCAGSGQRPAGEDEPTPRPKPARKPRPKQPKFDWFEDVREP
jgi:hypothetical protein